MTLKRKIALVDLTRQAITIKAMPDEWRSRFIGGRGIGNYLFWRYGAVDCDALSADNTIVINAGLLSGTLPSVHAYGSIISKSPLTGFLTCTILRGPFAAEMRWAGFDHVVVRGRSKNPVFLFIKDGDIEIRDAVQFWGYTTKQARGAILRELGDREIKTFQIGPAGENLVRFATVITDRGTSTGRTGLGAVLGSKKIKAIACRGTGDLEVKFPERVLKLEPGLTAGNRGAEKGPRADENAHFSDQTIKAIKEIATDGGMDAGTVLVMLQLGCMMFDKGLIDRRHTHGLVLDRGNTKSLATLAGNISSGNNFGRALGQGPLLLAVKFGFEPLEWLASAENFLEIYSESDTGDDRLKESDPHEPAGLWQLPGGPGQVAVEDLYDMICGCLGVANPSGITKASISTVFDNISEVIRMNTGLTFDANALFTIAYRCYALERLFNSSVDATLRKQNQSDLNLDVPAAYPWLVNLKRVKELKKIRLTIDRHYRMNGWGPSKLIKKKVFGLLEIGDLWAVLRKRQEKLI